MADLLSREGHPLAARVDAERTRRPDPRDLEAGPPPRRTLGMAAGAVLVLGTVVAGALGLSHAPSTTPTAAAGEPVGALPGRGAPPVQPGQAAPDAPVQERFVNAAATQSTPHASSGRAGQIGVPASVAPPAAPAAPKAPRSNPPAQQPNQQPPANPAPQAPAPGPVQTLSEPVTETVGGNTLTDAVTPVTQTVDHTLQPALSLIGGLLGR